MPPDARIKPIQNLGLGFSGPEAGRVALGIALMTAAFAVAYIGGGVNLEIYFHIGGASLVLLVVIGSFVAVSTAFFAHEMAHKAVAQRYGAVAEYRHSPAGLALGLVTAALGFMIAIPGAVVIVGPVSGRRHAVISAAGPITNLAFAGAFIGLSVALGTWPGRFREPIPIFIGAIAFVNVMMALFNLLPVPAIEFRRKVAGRIPINITLPASDGYLTFASSRFVWGLSVAALVGLGLGGRMLGVF